MSDEQHNNNDEELAPMVDGLSGALCVLILITTVFMLSATDTMLSGISGYGFNFSDSKLDLKNNRIDFNAGVNLSYQDLYLVREELRAMKNPTLYVYIPKEIKNYRQKMVFNLSELNKKLDLDVSVNLRVGNAEVCGFLNSCIYWSE